MTDGLSAGLLTHSLTFVEAMLKRAYNPNSATVHNVVLHVMRSLCGVPASNMHVTAKEVTCKVCLRMAAPQNLRRYVVKFKKLNEYEAHTVSAYTLAHAVDVGRNRLINRTLEFFSVEQL